MATELPHALLSCTECGTGFKLTLKKGRPPSRPVPCPKCKAPITVTEDHIVEPGEKRAGTVEGGKLRETKPGDVLRQTKLVKPDEIPVDGMMDPRTGEVPVDPPTAEVEVDADDLSEGEDDASLPADVDATPAFGIVRRKKIGAKDPDKKPSNALMGVDVVKTKGSGARDNVFGQLKTGAMPLARIGAKAASKVADADIDDAELPAPVEASNAPKSPKKLNLEKLRDAMSKLDEDADDDAEEAFEQPLTDFGPDIDESEISEPDEDELPSLATDSEVDEEADEQAEPESDAEPDEADEADEAEDVAEADDDLEVEPSLDDGISESDAEAEPAVVTLDVEDSEGYELGDGSVPVRASAPKRQNTAGIVIGIFLLLAILGIAYIAIS